MNVGIISTVIMLIISIMIDVFRYKRTKLFFNNMPPSIYCEDYLGLAKRNVPFKCLKGNLKLEEAFNEIYR